MHDLQESEPKTMKNSIKHICCVDSINENIVRLSMGSDGEKTHLLPLELFPKGIKEGHWLDITINIDDKATKKGKQDVADLYKELEEGNS